MNTIIMIGKNSFRLALICVYKHHTDLETLWDWNGISPAGLHKKTRLKKSRDSREE